MQINCSGVFSLDLGPGALVLEKRSTCTHPTTEAFFVLLIRFSQIRNMRFIENYDLIFARAMPLLQMREMWYDVWYLWREMGAAEKTYA
jgi:hypothetical protein